MDANQKTLWFMEGNVCADDDKECVPGMQVSPEGKVVIGGKAIKQAIVYDKDTDLSQWPFADVPDLKLKKFHKSAPDEHEPKLKLF